MLGLVLAGGRGTRLRLAADGLPKPLVRVAGRSLLEWSLDTLEALNAGEVRVLCAEDIVATLLEELASKHRPTQTAVQVVPVSTDSGLETFCAAADGLEGHRFIMMCVDAVIPRSQLPAMSRALERDPTGAEFLVGCTARRTDESPTYARIEAGVVTEIGKDIPPTETVTAGLYACPVDFTACLDDAILSGMSHLGSLLGYFCENVRPGKAIQFEHAFDIDTPEDRAWAEYCLRTCIDRDDLLQ